VKWPGYINYLVSPNNPVDHFQFARHTAGNCS
jgi:hypothetical protein